MKTNKGYHATNIPVQAANGFFSQQSLFSHQQLMYMQRIKPLICLGSCPSVSVSLSVRASLRFAVKVWPHFHSQFRHTRLRCLCTQLRLCGCQQKSDPGHSPQNIKTKLYTKSHSCTGLKLSTGVSVTKSWWGLLPTEATTVLLCALAFRTPQMRLEAMGTSHTQASAGLAVCR